MKKMSSFLFWPKVYSNACTEPAVLDNFEKFLFDQPVAVTVSFRRKKLQEVPQPPNTFTHPHCRQLHVLTLCILLNSIQEKISAMMF
jgi:hypothetical protein